MTAKRGPKPLKPIQDPDAHINQELLAVDMQAGMQAAADWSRLQDSYPIERDALNQMIGRVQMGQAIGGLTNMMNLQYLKSIKESKSYKSLAGQTGTDRKGLPIANLGTWEGFCRGLGMSPDKVDMDLQNLDAFGQDALESLSAIGVGYRELRQYRKLPEDRKAALIEIAKTGDKEGFAELVEEIISKHVKEKEALEKQVVDALEEKTTAENHLRNVRMEQQRKEGERDRFAALSKGDKLKELQTRVMADTHGVHAALHHLRGAMEEMLQVDKKNAPFLAGLLKQLNLEMAQIEEELQLPNVSDMSTTSLEWLAFQRAEESQVKN